jgi:hypothetical protein
LAHETGALRTRDLKRVTVDTTVQPKAITFPTDAKLLHAAIKGLNRLACKCGLRPRQSYLRIAKSAAMMAGRYAHAKQFKRHRRQLRLLRSRLGRIIRDLRRKIAARAELEPAFQRPLALAEHIRPRPRLAAAPHSAHSMATIRRRARDQMGFLTDDEIIANLSDPGFAQPAMRTELSGRLVNTSTLPYSRVEFDRSSDDGSPLTVSVYINGRPRLMIKTAGSKDDVARALNLRLNEQC